MADKGGLNRREFMGAVGVGLLAPAALSAGGCGEKNKYVSGWEISPDRLWAGKDIWTNPWENWAVKDGKLICINTGEDYNAHNLLCQISKKQGSFATKVDVALSRKHTELKGRYGLRLAIQLDDPMDDYRSRLLHGSGIDAGLTTDGKIFIGESEKPLDADLLKAIRSGNAIRLSCQVTPALDNKYQIKLFASVGNSVTEIVSKPYASKRISGNIALFSNLKGSELDRDGIVSFSNWQISGDKVVVSKDQGFGPILWSLYTLDSRVMKMTAQMPPIGDKDSHSIDLQLKKDGQWKTIASEKIEPVSLTALFKIKDWDDTRDHDYRLKWTANYKNDTSEDSYFYGTVRRDPVDKPEIVAAGLCCFADYFFPNTNIVTNLKKQDPDVMFFMGDQIYEMNGGYGIMREGDPDRMFANYLRKVSLLMWSFRDIMADRPTICMPDDHDMYQGNIWGMNGRKITLGEWSKQSPYGDSRIFGNIGGYVQPAWWVNAVQRSQASHLPDPYDPTPIEQGITVYYSELYWGGVSFAILEDRKFKTGPMSINFHHDGPRPDHITDKFAAQGIDDPDARLYGQRQLDFIRHWIGNSHPDAMKIAVSQTIPSNAATHHGEYDNYVYADMDSNGWPQGGRNRFLETLKNKAFILAGDQHLPTIIRNGVKDWDDSCYSFCVPAGAVCYQRWWRPEEVGSTHEGSLIDNRPDTGRYRDGFGNKITMLAVANPPKPEEYKTLLEKGVNTSSGWGIIRVNKADKTIKMEAWKVGCDVTNNETENQYPGWPRTVKLP